MLVTCQRYGDWFLFGLVWQYSSIQKNIIKVGAKSWLLTCSYHITLSLPFYTDPDSKRELNFCKGYLSLLYFWLRPSKSSSPWVPEPYSALPVNKLELRLLNGKCLESCCNLRFPGPQHLFRSI